VIDEPEDVVAAAHAERAVEHVREAARDGDGVEGADRRAGRPDPDVGVLAVRPDRGDDLVLHVLMELVRDVHAMLGAVCLVEEHTAGDAVARVDLDASSGEQRLEHPDHQEALDLLRVTARRRKDEDGLT
jgi:hypothetical protein